MFLLTSCFDMFIVDNMQNRAENFVSPRLITEEILDYLRGAIVKGRLREGEKLSEPRLQEMFHTSRSPIREALGILEQEGLVVRVPRKGAFVGRITLEELNETTIVVAALEGLAARLSVSRLTKADLMKMERLVRDMEREVEKYAIDKYTETHKRFHEIFVSKCGNKILSSLIISLRQRYVRPRVTSYYFKHNLGTAVSSHVEIVVVLRKGDPAAAENVVKQHVMTGLVTNKELWEE